MIPPYALRIASVAAKPAVAVWDYLYGFYQPPLAGKEKQLDQIVAQEAERVSRIASEARQAYAPGKAADAIAVYESHLQEIVALGRAQHDRQMLMSCRNCPDISAYIHPILWKEALAVRDAMPEVANWLFVKSGEYLSASQRKRAKPLERVVRIYRRLHHSAHPPLNR